jgi:spore maturation protein CgeB
MWSLPVKRPLNVVILGLSVTSSWGNGHATTYRSLLRGLAAHGHRTLFLERNLPWYAENRDEPNPYGARTELYESLDDLTARFEREVTDADLVIVGSYVPDGVAIGAWVNGVAKGLTAFYDIDTPVTMSRLRTEGATEYITPELIRQYAIYLSFTGGPLLREIETRYGARMARELYCSVDTELYVPSAQAMRWDLGYLGTYSNDRQPALDELLLEPARQWHCGRFAVTGPMYPESIVWPENVAREIHLSPREHPGFYGSQRFTLNITRTSMKEAGYSPSVRLFEAGACATPIVSDWWEGFDSLFEVRREALIASNAEEVLRYLRDVPDAQRLAIGAAARARILAEHTPEHRALQIEAYVQEFHDHFSAGSPRRNGLSARQDKGLAAGLASQPARANSGEGSGGKDAAISGSSHLHQPAGANR